MIKVTFKNPQKLSQSSIICECLFVFCKSIKFRYYSVCSVTDEDILLITTGYASNIQSIEHVKPSEL